MTISGGNIFSFYPSAWVGGGFRDFWFDTSPPALNLRTVIYSSEEAVAVKDLIYTRSVGSDSLSDYIWNYDIPGYVKTREAITRSSSNSGLLIPNPSDPYKWDYVGSGTVDITLSCPSRTYTTQVKTLNVTGANISFFGYASGSLREHVNRNMDMALSGKTTSNMRLFSLQNHTSAIYTRNTGCWANYADLTPISPWNNYGINTETATLISPRHVVYSAHAMQYGGTIRFVTNDNQVITRSVSNVTALSGFGVSGSLYPDIAVGVLDSDVPSSIKFAKILPSNWDTKIPSLSQKDIPLLVLDQERKALIHSLHSLSSGSGVYGAIARTRPAAESQRRIFYERIVKGDSSSPFFLIVNNELVLITTAVYDGGTSYQYYKNEINSLMTSLGGGYQLTEIDLSSFISY